MRKLVFSILLLIYAFHAHTTDVSIKTLTIDGKPYYKLEAGAFPNENSALQMKLKLSASLKQPITINFDPNSRLYIVTVGPLSDLQTAGDVQQQLKNDNSINTMVLPTTTAHSPAPQVSNEPPPPPEETPSAASVSVGDDGKKLWNLNNADIRAVIAEVSRVTSKNFIIDPRVQGKISIVSGTPISDHELYQVFLSVLQVSGYAAIPSGDVIKIIPNIDAKTVTTDLLSRMRNPPHGDEMLVEVVPVHYVPADQLVPVLRPLMPQWSNVSSYAPSNMIILSGRANNIRHLAEIIRQVDTSSANGIDIVPLRHALAMDIASTLKDIVKTPSGGANHTQVSLAADDRSNAILISGTRTDRLRLRILISKLDRSNTNGIDSHTQVVYLSYLRAEDLVPILAGIAQANFSGTVGTTIGTITRPELDSTNPASNLANGTSSTNTSTTTSTSVSSTSSATAVNPSATANTSTTSTQNEGTTKPTVQIIAEPNTNSIIINAPPTLIRILKSVIGQLDIRPAQLLIEAMVAEVDESDVNSLGIEWGSDQQTGRPSDFRPGFAIINSKTTISDFQAQIYALARRNRANVLSTPSVVVLDNRQAKILVGKQVSVASTTYPNNAGGTTTASPYVTFDRVNVALHLYVRPQITRGQGIQLQIDQGNDTIDPTSALTPTDNPVFKISSIVTAVHVESGDIVVLGGLKQDSLGNDDNRLSILGDIPGIGRLFQHNIRSREKRVLMVFIRTIILKNERDAVQITNGKYNDIRQYQLDWLRTQEYDKTNNNVVLPPLKRADLPKPFGQVVPETAIKNTRHG